MDLFPKNDHDTNICLIHKPIEIENLTTRIKHRDRIAQVIGNVPD